MPNIKTESMAIREGTSSAISSLVSCKIWFPCTETSGTTVTGNVDQVASRVWTPVVAPAFAVTGAIRLQDTGTGSALTSGTLPTLADTSDWLLVISYRTRWTGSPTANTTLLSIGNPGDGSNTIVYRMNNAGTATPEYNDSAAGALTITNSVS